VIVLSKAKIQPPKNPWVKSARRVSSFRMGRREEGRTRETVSVAVRWVRGFMRVKVGELRRVEGTVGVNFEERRRWRKDVGGRWRRRRRWWRGWAMGWEGGLNGGEGARGRGEGFHGGGEREVGDL